MFHRRGFTLLELSVALVLTGLVAALALKIMDRRDNAACYVTTKKQIESIKDAVERFAMKNDRFPLPARRNVGIDDPNYGREVAQNQVDSQLNKVVSGSDAAVFGALPFQALGIPVENASDCWGNKLTYVVSQSLTVPKDASGNNAFLDPDSIGAIDIKTNNSIMFLHGAGYAIISHGADQLGAVKNNYSGSDRKWCGASMNGDLRTQNCDVQNNVLISAEFNDGKNGATKFFDDVIVYRGKPWRLTPVNGVCGAASNSCAKGTASGYSAGSCGGNQSWTCLGKNGGTDAPCTLANPACTGVCGASLGTCSSGTPTNISANGGCGGYDTWQCVNGGATTCYSAQPSCGGGGGGGGNCTASCPGNATWGAGCSTNPNKCPGYDQNVPVTSTAPYFAGSATVSCVGGNWIVAGGASCTEQAVCGSQYSGNTCEHGTANNSSNQCDISGHRRLYTWNCVIRGWVNSSYVVINSVSCNGQVPDNSCPP